MPVEPGDTDDLLTATEVAKIARVSRTSVHRWALEGLLPIAMQTPGGGRRWFRRSDVERLLFPQGAPTETVAS